MNFSEKLAEAKRFLEQGAVSQAVLAGGRLLETLLRSAYQELLPKLPPQQAAKVTQTLEKVGKGKGVDDLTLGQLVRLFQAGSLLPLIKKFLNRDLYLLTNEQRTN